MAVKLYDTEKVADTFNKIFVNIDFSEDKRFIVETNHVFDPVLKAVKKYSAHPSILNVKVLTTCSFFDMSLMKKF